MRGQSDSVLVQSERLASGIARMSEDAELQRLIRAIDPLFGL